MGTKKIHRAWVNVVALCLIMAGTYGVLINTIGVLFSAIMEDTGISNGSLSVYYTIRNLTSALTVVFTTKLFLKKNARLVMAALCTIMALSIGAMSMFTHVYQWYIAGVFTGIGQSCIYVMVPIVINNWFRDRNGFAIGLSMSASGIFSAICSPIVSSIILAFNWRAACLIMMGLALVLTIPACLFLLKRNPDSEADCYRLAAATGKKEEGKADTGLSAAPSLMILTVCFAYCMFGSIYAPINHQIAVFGNSVGLSLTLGATMTSFSMAGNLIGKLAVGYASDRIGIFNAIRLSLALVFIGLVLFVVMPGVEVALLIGAFLYGITYSFGSAQSLIFLAVYGPETYKERLAQVSSIGGIVGALLSAGVGYLYDFAGSFNPVFIIAMGFAAVQIVIATILKSDVKKRTVVLSK